MVSFRRLILALTVPALFAGLASAQVSGNTTLTCATNVSVTPTLRAEGYTEQTGDITLTCTGGAYQAVGSAIPQVNIQIFLNTAITSRLLPATSSGLGSQVSEALLMIDEPGSGLTPTVPLFGPAAGQNICTTPLTGCIEYVNSMTVGTDTYAVAVDAAGNTTPGKNVFQGVVNGNSVTFFGVPVLAPVTSGISRVFRITNIRANATALAGGSAAGATPVIASISISGATSLLITNPTPTVGFVQSGLTASASSSKSLTQCTSITKAAVNTLTFTENFGTAFKTRVYAQGTGQYAGQINSPIQNVPGAIYNSESNFVLGPVPSNGGTAGLADYGTRLKASFSNIPAGIRLFVSTQNVYNDALTAIPAGYVAGSSTWNTGQTTYVQLVSSETVNDGNAIGGFFPGVSSTDSASTGSTPIVEIPVSSSGTAQAVWEVMNTNPNAIDSFKVAVYATYSANVAQNSPPPGTAQVNLSFAPTPTAAFSASSAAMASSSLPIPRFIPDPNAPRNIFNINICRTVLLYPYVTNQAGYDTGVAISNTSMDPFGTGNQAGTCSLNWYQGTSNPAPTTTPVIAAGTTWATLASITVPGFGSGGPTGAGYMIAVCNFQLAHGFAVVQDLGGRNFGMSYLALVVPDPGTGTRAANGLDKAATGTGENIAH